MFAAHLYRHNLCPEHISLDLFLSQSFSSIQLAEILILSHVPNIWVLCTTLTELIEEDDVEKKTEQEESEEEFGTGIHPTAGKDWEVLSLQVDQDFGTRKLHAARRNWAVHWK